MNNLLAKTWVRVLPALTGGILTLASTTAWLSANPPPGGGTNPVPPPTHMPGQGAGTAPTPGNGGNQPIVGDQEFVQIAPGYLLYAEKFLFRDTTRSSGRAIGHVFIQLPPNFALLGVTFVHAETADFDVRRGWMILRGWPEVLIGTTIHRAADETTRMRLTWLGPERGLTTVGTETQQTLRPGDIRGRLEEEQQP